MSIIHTSNKSCQCPYKITENLVNHVLNEALKIYRSKYSLFDK
jgi:hypothetical protein